MRFALDSTDATLIGDELGSGPTCVLLHAGAERRQVWDPIVEHLAATGHRCVTLDLRGHGESTGSRDVDFGCFARDIGRLRARLARPAVYVGASLGGLSILGMAGAVPPAEASDIAGVVLVDVVPDPDPERVYPGLTAALGDRVARSHLVADILSRAEELRAAARTLVAPTLLVRAERSFGIDAQSVERFRALVPHAQVVAVHSGHLIAREQPRALAELLCAFAGSPKVVARCGSGDRAGPVARAEAWLHAHNARTVAHLAGTLLEHLRRTALWLDRWEAPEHVRLAGLCHAAYGTDGFDTVLTTRREALREAIGPSAERLVYDYAFCDRRHFYGGLAAGTFELRDRVANTRRVLRADEVGDLVVLTLANELDVALHAAPESELRRSIVELFRVLAQHRPAEATAALKVLERRYPSEREAER